MSNEKQMMFSLLKFQILQTKANPQTERFISDDYAYAWSSGLYPYFQSDNEWVEQYEECFPIKKDIVSNVIEYLDSEWMEGKYYDFYTLIEYFEKKETFFSCYNYGEKKTILIEVLKYVFLHGGFDSMFWDTLLTDTKYPIEAKSIIAKFDIDGINLC